MLRGLSEKSGADAALVRGHQDRLEFSPGDVPVLGLVPLHVLNVFQRCLQSQSRVLLESADAVRGAGGLPVEDLLHPVANGTYTVDVPDLAKGSHQAQLLVSGDFEVAPNSVVQEHLVIVAQKSDPERVSVGGRLPMHVVVLAIVVTVSLLSRRHMVAQETRG